LNQLHNRSEWLASFTGDNGIPRSSRTARAPAFGTICACCGSLGGGFGATRVLGQIGPRPEQTSEQTWD
jgi:hypothetical protein